MSGVGLFVAIEGIDGSGTTTQARLVSQRLAALGHTARSTREPSDRELGRMIRTQLARRDVSRMDERTLALLFAADRLDHYQQEILPGIKQGVVVLCDRYVLSSLVYQGELLGNDDWVASINRQATQPDLTALIAVDAVTAAKRRQSRHGPDDRYEEDALQARLVERYKRLVTSVPGHIVIDGTATPDVVADQLTAAIIQRLAIASR